MTLDVRALLLGASDRAIALMDRFASCFADAGPPELVEHKVAKPVEQRRLGIAWGDVAGRDCHAPPARTGR